MASLEYCFYCCEHISPEDYKLNQFGILRNALTKFNCETDLINNNGNSVAKEHILKISHYLNVPRKLLDQFRVGSTVIKACPDCAEISKILSDYCTQLELIKMKIGYYLNQLNNKITSNSTDVNNMVKQPDPNLSKFQKSVHQNCLRKIQNDGSNHFPKVRLEKLPNRPEKIVQQVKLEDIHQHPVILDEIEDQIKIEHEPMFLGVPNSQDIDPELHSCPFCTFVVEGFYEELQTHITTNHPEQFQIEDTEPSAIFSNMPADKQTECSSNLNSTDFKCKTCGKSFSLRINLRRHISRSAVCGQADNASKRERADRYKFSKCEYCGMLIYSRNLKRHLDYRHPNGITIISQRREQTCKHCNLTVGNSKKLRVHMLACHGVELPNHLFKCEGCNNSYELKTSLTRHLRKSEKCRLAAERVNQDKDRQEMGNEIKRALMVDFRGTDEDLVMTVNDMEVSEQEDPLAI